jgi:hypothetical protein
MQAPPSQFSPGSYSPQPPPGKGARTGIVFLLAALWLATVAGAFFAGREAMRAEVRKQVAEVFRPQRAEPGKRLNSNSNENPPNRQGNVEVVSASPEELMQWFSDNPVRAEEWLKGKSVRVTGKLSHVSNNMFGGDRFAVVLDVNVQSMFKPTIQFWFDGSFRAQAAELVRGQSVTCEGTYEEQEFGGDLKFEGTGLH